MQTAGTGWCEIVSEIKIKETYNNILFAYFALSVFVMLITTWNVVITFWGGISIVFTVLCFLPFLSNQIGIPQTFAILIVCINAHDFVIFFSIKYVD